MMPNSLVVSIHVVSINVGPIRGQRFQLMLRILYSNKNKYFPMKNKTNKKEKKEN